MRRISIFGATGSVGASTFDLICRAGGADAFQTAALTGGRNVAALARMARTLRAEVAVTAHEECLKDLRSALSGSGIRAEAGAAAIVAAAQIPTDWVMSAIVGNAGLPPSFAANTKTLALANKESLVTAGPLLMANAAAKGTRILPVDSEHSAIFQCLAGADMSSVARVILTASGGALRDWPLERLARATVAQASTHPNWDMGQRITIDSASMFNKAMEVIEAREFFGLRPDQIQVVVHPQSIIHAMVAFQDGATLAHMGAPDMRHAIGFALNYPARAPLPVAQLDLVALGRLDFTAPDETRFAALRLARAVMAARGPEGGGAGAVFTAAKEVALDLFLAGQIGFMDMAPVVEAALDRLSAEIVLSNAPQTLEAVLEIDHLTRVRAHECAATLMQGR